MNRTRGLDRKGGRVLPNSEAARNRALRAYRHNATKRNIPWLLPDSWAVQLMLRDCFYCESAPANEMKTGVRSGVFTYNGIDRVDNREPYALNNCVPCCFDCNAVKRTFTIERLREHLGVMLITLGDF